MEIEAKFAVSSDAAAWLRRHPLLAHYRLRGPRSRWVESEYHDTPGLDLLRQGLELRLRRDGIRHVQTLKAVQSPSGSLHRRQEWECPLRGPALDIEALAALLPSHAAATARLLHAYAAGGELEPRVRTRFHRTTWPLRSARGDEVELALDQGEVRAGGQRLELCELELELKSGQVSALFELAGALHAGLPLRPETRGKAERGFALLAGERALPRHAPKVHIDRAASPAAALGAMVEECLAQVQANAAGVVDSDDPEFVHQMRVGLRRLRSALALFKEFASPAEVVMEGMRWSAAQLGCARDAEVLAQETLARIPSPQTLASEWRGLQEAAAAAATHARRLAAEAVGTPRHVAWQLALMAWVTSLMEANANEAQAPSHTSTRASLADLAQRKLRRLRKRLRARGEGLKGADAQARHRLRIAVKKLRYATEMLGGAPGRLRPLIALQDQLGLLNDAEVTGPLLTRIAAETPALASSAHYAQGWLAGEAERRLRALWPLWQRARREL